MARQPGSWAHWLDNFDRDRMTVQVDDYVAAQGPETVGNVRTVYVCDLNLTDMSKLLYGFRDAAGNQLFQPSDLPRGNASALYSLVVETANKGTVWQKNNRRVGKPMTWQPKPQPAEVDNAAVEMLTEMVKEALAKVDGITDGMTETFSVIANEMLAKGMAQIEQAARDLAPTYNIVTVNVADHEPVKVEGAHEAFGDVMDVLAAGLVPWLVGPAGTGKSTILSMAADALGVPFYAISGSQQTPRSEVTGGMTANGYLPPAMYHAMKEGGFVCIDEADAWNANTFLTINMIVANRMFTFPNGETVRAHENFYVGCTANTSGHGASRDYNGRNPIDFATLDRFEQVFVGIDENLETQRTMLINAEHGAEWLRIVRASRKRADDLNLKLLISPRAAFAGAALLKNGRWTMRKVANGRWLAGLGPEETRKMTEGIF